MVRNWVSKFATHILTFLFFLASQESFQIRVDCISNICKWYVELLVKIPTPWFCIQFLEWLTNSVGTSLYICLYGSELKLTKNPAGGFKLLVSPKLTLS